MKAISFIACLFLFFTGMAQVDTLSPQLKDTALMRDIQKAKNSFFETNKFDAQKLYELQRLNIKDTIPLRDKFKPTSIMMEKGIIVEAFSIEIEEVLEQVDPLDGSKKLRGPSKYDSRIELRQFNIEEEWEHRVVNNAASVGLVVKKENLYPLTDSIFQLGTELTLGKRYNLCPGQAFAEQPVAGEGTAFIIEDGRFVTAGHVFSEPLDHYAIIFGFEILNKVGAYERLVPAANIYYPKKIVERDDELDITIIEADRVPNRPPLAISKKDAVMLEEVYMIGYPSGLPIKVALNARVRSMDQRQYFYTSLDAFQGNSGSPVFSFKTHEVIGVLVSGELDYVWTGSCNVTTLCAIPYCKGEKVIRIAEVLKQEDR